MKFHYGQRVRCVSPPDNNESCVGLTGVVYYDGETGVLDGWVAVEFDNPIPLGHTIIDQLNPGKYHGFNETGWNCPPETLIPIEESIDINEII